MFSKKHGPKTRTATGKTSTAGRHRVGVVADTHGLLRPELIEAFAGVDLIVHAGDVGNEALLDRLEAIAPVVAVRGNMDRDRWTGRLRYSEAVEVGGVLLYAIHDVADLDLNPAAAGIRVVVSGHTHYPSRDQRDGVLYLNPGSAGPRRGDLPASAVLLEIDGNKVESHFLKLAG
ncbi:MAG: metallophosphoesterase family protein [Anaerolineae bacterium]|jgi:putative phosphoesterase